MLRTEIQRKCRFRDAAPEPSARGIPAIFFKFISIRITDRIPYASRQNPKSYCVRIKAKPQIVLHTHQKAYENRPSFSDCMNKTPDSISYASTQNCRSYCVRIRRNDQIVSHTHQGEHCVRITAKPQIVLRIWQY